MVSIQAEDAVDGGPGAQSAAVVVRCQVGKGEKAEGGSEGRGKPQSFLSRWELCTMRYTGHRCRAEASQRADESL